MNKASGGDGIPGELFQTLKDDSVKVPHLICQQIWKTQQWPQDWKRSVFIQIPKGNALQGIFPTHGLNPGLPHCRQILYQLSHKESPRIPSPGIEHVLYLQLFFSTYCANATERKSSPLRTLIFRIVVNQLDNFYFV